MENNKVGFVFMPNQHELKALTWKQPFADLMLDGKIETRTWPTKYRGWVLICAGLQPYSTEILKAIAGNQYERIKARQDYLDGIGPQEIGHAIAIGRLVDCRSMTPADAEKCFVEFRDGLWCHIYEDVQAIEPMPWKGAQGWRNVSDDVKQSVKIIAS